MSTSTPAIARLAALLPGYGVSLAPPPDGPEGDEIRSAAAKLGALVSALADAGVFDAPDDAIRRGIVQAAREVARLLAEKGLIRTRRRAGVSSQGQGATDAPGRGPLAEAPPLDPAELERTLADLAEVEVHLRALGGTLGDRPEPERHAALSVLAGQFRVIHDAVTPAGCRSPADVQAPLSALHATLVGLVRTHEAGYVLPLKLTHREDWAAFVGHHTRHLERLRITRREREALEQEPRLLLEEIEAGEPGLRLLPPEERRAVVSVWAGKVRRAQAHSRPAGEVADLLRAIFGRLMAVAGDPATGEVSAMRREFTCDWDVYIATHEAKVRESEAEREAAERKAAARDIEAAAALEALAAAVERVEGGATPESGEALRTATLAALRYGVTDELVDLVRPHEAAFSGRDFRALRNRLEKEREPARAQQRLEVLATANADLLAWTTGKRACLIGGDRREDARAQDEAYFKFASLEWRPTQAGDARGAQALAESVKAGGCDLVLIAAGFTGHYTDDLLVPACKAAGVPYAWLRFGYRPPGIVRSLRDAFGGRGSPRGE